VLCVSERERSKELYLLFQRSKRDFSNFDSDFISENPNLTPIDGDTVRSLNQTEFEGFTFTNSEFKE
jgi:hypothetical protein